MKDSGVIILLKTFSKKEIRQFEKFLKSPYFTEGKNIRSKILLKFFSLIKPHYPEFESLNFTNQNIYKSLYPSKDYNDAVIRKLSSDLKKLGESFIALKEFEKDTLGSQKYLLEAMSSRRLDKQFNKQLKNTNSSLAKLQLNSDYFLNKKNISRIVNNFYFFRNEMVGKYNLQKEVDYFVSFTLAHSLELYRNMINLEEILNIRYKKEFFTNVLKFITKNKLLIQSNPLMEILYYECMLNVHKKEEYYIILKELKDKYLDLLDEQGLQNIFTSLANFCVRMGNSGRKGYNKERFQLDKEIMFLDYYSKKEYIDINYFSATARNAISLGELGWAESFIEKYKTKLDPKHSSFILSYIQALLHFTKKNYGEALEYLSKINIEYSQRKQQLKNLQLKIFYETEAYESAYSLIDSSLHSLKKERQMLQGRKSSHLNFLKHTKELIDLKLNQNKIDKSELENKLNKASYFANKEWLIEKIRTINI